MTGRLFFKMLSVRPFDTAPWLSHPGFDGLRRSAALSLMPLLVRSPPAGQSHRDHQVVMLAVVLVGVNAAQAVAVLLRALSDLGPPAGGRATSRAVAAPDSVARPSPACRCHRRCCCAGDFPANRRRRPAQEPGNRALRAPGCMKPGDRKPFPQGKMLVG